MLKKKYWGFKDGTWKTVWVSWEDVTMPKYIGGWGFCNTELFSLAMLAKHGWKILQEPMSLGAKVLKVFCYPFADILDLELGNHPRQACCAIHAGMSVL